VSYTVLPQTKPTATVTKDISGGGLCFFAQAPLKSGTRLQATVSLPERAQPIPFIAEVTGSEQTQMVGEAVGERAVEVDVRFIEMAPQDQVDLMQYIMVGLQPPALS
jgi:hypothetical protein